MKHTVRTKDGSITIIENYTRNEAIKAMCTECICWQGNPKKDCTSPLCPLYPYRAKSEKAYRSTLTVITGQIEKITPPYRADRGEQ